MYLQCWGRSSKEDSQSRHEYVNKSTLTHKHTYLYSTVNPFWRGKHEITVDMLERKQRNVWGWLTKMKMKRRRDRERRPRGSTHTHSHQQAKPLPAPIRPDYTPSTGCLPSRHENTPVNHPQDPKLSQACITEHKSTWRKGERVYCTVLLRSFHTKFRDFLCHKQEKS